MSKPSKREQVVKIVKKHTLVRPRDLEAVGLPRDYLYQLAKTGVLKRIGRGLYSWPGKEIRHHQSLVEVSKKAPNCVVALLSALSFHELTTQNPYEVWLAIDRKARRPVIDYPPVRWIYMSELSKSEGVETQMLDGVKVKIFSPGKTIADCFKYRNKIGLDVALEALKKGWEGKCFTMDELFHYAKICRVQNVMRPYLEALV